LPGLECENLALWYSKTLFFGDELLFEQNLDAMAEELKKLKGN
jgi:hypothetical protein